MIRFGYSVEKCKIYVEGHKLLSIPDSLSGYEPITKIINCLEDGATWVEQEIEIITDFEVENLRPTYDTLDDWIKAVLTEKYVPIWRQGLLQLTYEEYERYLRVRQAPGWLEVIGKDKVALLLDDVLEAYRLSRPTASYEKDIDVYINWAVDGRILPIANLLPHKEDIDAY